MAEVATPTTAPATPSGSTIPTPQLAPTRRKPSELADLTVVPDPVVDLNEPEFDPNADPSAEMAPDAVPDEVIDEQPDAQPLFGMEPDALLAELRAGKLPAGMLDQVWAEVPYIDANGQQHTVRMTMNELRKSAMLRSEFTRKTQELSRIRGEADRVIQERQQLDQQLRDPRHFRRWVEESGKFEAFEAAAQELAREYAAFYKMSPAEQNAYIQSKELEHKERALTAREKAAEEAQRQNQRAQAQAKHRADLERMVPVAFQKYRIQDGKLAQKIIGEEILAIANGIPNERFTGITQDMCNEAAQATLERLREMARYQEPVTASNLPNRPASTNTRPQPGLSPTALPGGRPPGSPATRPTGRARIDNFGALMNKRR
jgi:hypothetical protein